MRSYILGLLVAADQFLNAVFAGDPDETISSRVGKLVGTCRVCRWFCWLLDRLDRGHCQRSIEPDEGYPQPNP